jgi:hypothetical protein
MWCPQCQAEGPGEVAPGTGRLLCAACGTEVPASRTSPRPNRNPQDLLAKWAREDELDGLPPPRVKAPTSSTVRGASHQPLAPAAIEIPTSPPASAPRPRLSLPPTARRPFERSVSRSGQVLAYAGIAILGAGSGLIIFDHFGGQAGWALYGWIVGLVGQSLLLLGVVTLVMHGLDQTAEELNHRLQELSDQIDHIEVVVAAPAGDSSTIAA